MSNKTEIDAKTVLVAKKAVKLNGRMYQAGDVMTDSTVDLRMRMKLHRVGILIAKDDAVENVVEAPAVVAEVKDTDTVVLDAVEPEVVEEDTQAVEVGIDKGSKKGRK